MDRDQRNALRKTVEQARRLLEEDISAQLEGDYNILPDGSVLEDAPGDAPLRARLVEMLEHFRAGGAKADEAVSRLARECAFTLLNRFAALKMAERRGLVKECISGGEGSVAVQELRDLAPGLQRAFEDGGYRLILETIMDELSLGLEQLFDRSNPTGLLWPRPVALRQLLGLLNDEAIGDVWAQDETIGWIYQYFNSQDERQAMRRAGAPRNSRELAVRNQFFTPRYVVAFLTDNTLGRTWYEMRQGRTRLAETCEYLVLPSGEDPESLQRAAKDPRDLRILDPACGSGHFLLYAYDLLETIYWEAWADESWPASAHTGRSLRADYPEVSDLRRALPGLILQHNLYGIDIDSRAVQIAALSVWLRAQRTFDDMEIRPADRPTIEKAHLITAEPMPGEQELLEEFVQTLHPPLLGQVVRETFKQMRLAGVAGPLLKVEEDIHSTLERAREQWLASPREVQLSLLEEAAQPSQGELDLSGIDEARFWEEAESRIYEALARYASKADHDQGFRRRLFSQDAARGFAFLDACRQRYDVVLMNPPFGDSAKTAKSYIDKNYPRTKNDLYAAFVERGVSVLHRGGTLGAITSRTGFFLKSFQRWRAELLLEEAPPTVVADLGHGVMDAAMVEAAAYCLEAR